MHIDGRNFFSGLHNSKIYVTNELGDFVHASVVEQSQQIFFVRGQIINIFNFAS